MEKLKIKTTDLVKLLTWIYYNKKMLNMSNNNLMLNVSNNFDYEEVSKLIVPEKKVIEIDKDVFSNILNDNVILYERINDEYLDTLEKILPDEKTKGIVLSSIYEHKNLFEKYILFPGIKIKKSKQILKKMLDDNIKIEEYEICAKIRDKLSEF